MRGRACVVAAAGALAAFTAFTAEVGAQKAYPDRPVRLVVAFGAGGSSDTVARTVAQRLAEGWGQPVVVENRTGATGTIAADLVARAPGDGHTLLFSSALSTAAALYATLPFDWQRDLVPIVQTTAAPQVLYVHPSLPVKNVKDLIAFARQRPGELGYASSGIGSVAHLSGASLGLASGLKLIHVPYKSNGAAAIDVIGGHVPIMFDQLATAVPNVRAGKVRALAVTSPRRVAPLPEVPTMIELGFADFETSVWHGVMGPGTMPKEVVARINGEVNRVLKLPDVRDRLTALGLEVVGGSPEAFAAEMKKEFAWASKTIRAAAIKPE
ncbi:MAG: tripartite tricarboxylate transporter substrate binding protein [Proteobacteria bacterium]|nr:tripartite tricarboxylate transporter substrate binding protein [Burkholderiales bacterium]